MKINIYKITNKVNNKIYVGRTKHNIEKRFRQHITSSNRKENEFNYFMRAIRKYNSENFIISLIESCDELSMYDREKYHIQSLQSYKPDIGYNTSWVSNGSNGNIKKDTKTRLSESSKSYWNTIPKEQRSQMLSARLNGISKTQEHKRNLSIGKTGIKNNTGVSKYKGVATCSNNNGYRCTFYYGNSQSLTIGGSTTTELDAATLWDTIIYKTQHDINKLNFPHNKEQYETTDLINLLITKFELPMSKYKHITYHKKDKILKKCNTENEALQVACDYFKCNPTDLVRPKNQLERFVTWYNQLSSNK